MENRFISMSQYLSGLRNSPRGPLKIVVLPDNIVQCYFETSEYTPPVVVTFTGCSSDSGNSGIVLTTPSVYRQPFQLPNPNDTAVTFPSGEPFQVPTGDPLQHGLGGFQVSLSGGNLEISFPSPRYPGSIEFPVIPGTIITNSYNGLNIQVVNFKPQKFTCKLNSRFNVITTDETYTADASMDPIPLTVITGKTLLCNIRINPKIHKMEIHLDSERIQLLPGK